jgi:hypothetical protein
VKLTLPIYLYLPRKTKADKKISLGLNWYRNAQFFESNAVKVLFKELVGKELLALGKIAPFHRISATYTFYFARKCDTGNFFSVIEKFFLDALVEMGLLPDDNCEYALTGTYHFGGYDKARPRVEIEINEAPEEPWTLTAS